MTATTEAPASATPNGTAPGPRATISFESIKVEGAQLIDLVKKLIHEGNVRRISIKQGEHTIVEFPLTIGIVGTLIAPVLAAVGALAALVADCTLEVERTDSPSSPSST